MNVRFWYPCLGDLVLYVWIASRFARHELLPLACVVIHGKRYSRILNPSKSLTEKVPRRAIGIHDVKSPSIHINGTADGDVVKCVAP